MKMDIVGVLVGSALSDSGDHSAYTVSSRAAIEGPAGKGGAGDLTTGNKA